MRRGVTFGLLLAICALGLVAAIDALTGETGEQSWADSEERAGPASSSEDGTELAERLRRHGLTGVLYLSPAACESGEPGPLRALRLPELEPAGGREYHACSFSLSPDGEWVAAPTAIWDRQGQILAAPASGHVVVASPQPAWHIELPGSAPAFKPDGTLTQVRDGAVVEWMPECRDGDEVVTFLGDDEPGPRCPRTAVSRAEIGRAVPRGARLEDVESLVWASDSRVLAVLRADEGPFLAAYEDGRALGYANGLLFGSTRPPLASPDGSRVAIVAGRYVEVYDRSTGMVWGSSVEARALDWSPDGRWLAVAAPGRVYLVRASDWTVQFRLELSTNGVAWR